MSGRKSTEVAAVLAASQRGREEVNKNLDACMDAARSEYEANMQTARDLLEKLQSCSLAADVAGNEFPGEMASLKKRLEACRKTAEAAMPDGGKFAAVLAERQNLRAKLGRLDERARAIRKAIKSKDWYCDEEYDAACRLSGEFRDVYAAQRNLLGRAEAAARESRLEKNLVNEQLQLAAKLTDEARQLEERAKNRQQTKLLKDAMQRDLAAIDPQDAAKFLPGRLDALAKSCSEAMALEDAAFLGCADNLFQNLQALSLELGQKIAAWQKEKADIEGALDELGRQEAFALIGPVELYNEGDKGAKTQLFEYIRTYSGADLAPQYATIKNDLLAEFAAENFAACRALAEKAAQLLENARNTALELQRAMFDKTSLAGALQDTMEDLHYDTELEIVDGNPNNGFILHCRAGDEVIDFDRIDIDPDGMIVLNLNHHESIGGGCRASWETIARALRDAGIPVTDVKLAGNGSVFGKRAGGTKTENVGQRLPA